MPMFSLVEKFPQKIVISTNVYLSTLMFICRHYYDYIKFRFVSQDNFLKKTFFKKKVDPFFIQYSLIVTFSFPNPLRTCPHPLPGFSRPNLFLI